MNIKKKPEISLINCNLSDEKLNKDDTLLVYGHNAIGCKNFGIAKDIVDKYPYSDVAGLRNKDTMTTYIAAEENRGREGSCIINSPPLYIKGPKTATLISQYGFSKSIENNPITQKIVKRCKQMSYVRHLQADTQDNRLNYFNKCLFSLARKVTDDSEFTDIKNIILPLGIGRGIVDEFWLCYYFPIINQFAHDISMYGKKCYLAVKEPYFYYLEKNVNDDDDNFSNKAKCVFQTLSDLPWQDDLNDCGGYPKDDGNTVSAKTEEELNQMFFNNSVCSVLNDGYDSDVDDTIITGQDVPDTQFRYLSVL